MRHFAHNIGDYAAATAHLSFVEDAAYHRLLRRYYQDEKPLPAELPAVVRLAGARTKEERQAVANVLAEFFVLGADGYRQSRADREIEAYQAKAQAARENGTKGGRPVNREKTKTVATQVQSQKATTPHSPLPKEEPLPAAASSPITASVPVESPKAAAAPEVDVTLPSYLNRAARTAQDQAQAAWNAAAEQHGWKRVDYLTMTRRFGLDRIFALCGGIDGFKAALALAPDQEFLRTADGGWQGWFNFDQLLNEDKFTRLMEGLYAKRDRNDDRPDERSTSAALAGLREELAR